jgi:hypothetical protein
MAFTPYDPSVHHSIDLLTAILVPGTGLSIVPGSVNLKFGTGTQYDSTSGTSTTKTSVSFYDGTLPLGIGHGILLTSGDGTPPTSNTQPSYTVSFMDSEEDYGAAVDADLQAVASAAFSGAGSIRDASILTFTVDVTDPSVKSIRFDLVFGSDEYPEWVDSSFVDIAAVIVNGANYALFNSQPTQPLSVIQENLSVGNFADNAAGTIPIEYDGISQLLTIIVPVVTGTNSIKIGVADTGDQSYDSGLFVANIQGVGYTGAGIAQVITVSDTNASVTVQSGDMVYELPENAWSGTFSFSPSTPGNKTIVGDANDYIQAVFNFAISSVLDAFYSAFNTVSGTNSLTIQTPFGQYSFSGADLLVFQDAAYALDTYQGGDTWQAYALYSLAFGQPPSTATLSQWVKTAQNAASFDALAAQFLATYAPTATLEEVVSYLYQVVTQAVADTATIQNVIQQLAADGLTTAPQILAFAAENFADVTPILGQPVPLDPSLF